jgi:tRNA dimethylallyltransferase
METAQAVFCEIDSRAKPILAVGGTMLYVQGLTRGVFEGPSADDDFRREFRDRVRRDGLPALYAELLKVDPLSAGRIHANDQRRIERALEVYRLAGVPISEMQTQWEQGRSPYDCRVVALRRPQEEENRRINARVRRMIQAGLVQEVKALLAAPKPLSSQAAQAVGYAEIIAHLGGHMSLEGAIERIKINSRRLAKHQRTWMRRIPEIKWVDVTEQDTVASVADRVHSAWA